MAIDVVDPRFDEIDAAADNVIAALQSRNPLPAALVIRAWRLETVQAAYDAGSIKENEAREALRRGLVMAVRVWMPNDAHDDARLRTGENRTGYSVAEIMRARALRLDTVQHAYDSGHLDLAGAIELLAGPLNPDDHDAELIVVDDQAYLVRDAGNLLAATRMALAAPAGDTGNG